MNEKFKFSPKPEVTSGMCIIILGPRCYLAEILSNSEENVEHRKRFGIF